jgi:hypothetical protein
MGLKICVAALCASAIAVAAVAVDPADAQSNQKKRVVATKKVAVKGPPRTRITVQPRSFLDPGREVLPGSQSYFTNYAFPPTHSPTSVIEHRAGGHRSSALPGPFDLPGRDNPWPWHYCSNC